MQVLIVDDNEDAAASLAMLLELEDIPSQTAPDGEAALRLVQHTVPALLLIDISMPGMSGHELARRLRQLPQLRGSTLIAMSGFELPPGADQLRDTAFDQFWPKPFDPKKLLAEIKSVIRRPDRATADA
jgi:CheY-like chemotaxis protein